MPVLAWKYPATQPYQQSVARTIEPVFLVIDQDVTTFGTTVPDWTDIQSDVLLASYDEEPGSLDVATAAAFVAYCRLMVNTIWLGGMA